MSLEASTTLAGALQQVSEQSNGPEIWVDHDRTFRADAARGSGKRTSVLITSGQVLSASRAIRDEQVATVVIVEGMDDGNGSPMVTGTAVDTVEMARRGRMVRRVTAEHLQTQAAVNALAAEILAASKTPTTSYRISVSVDPERPVAASSLSAGDVVRIALEDPHLGSIREDVRVVSKRVEVIGRDTVRMDLDVETARFLPDGSVMGRYAKGRFTDAVIADLYDALYR